MLRDHNSILHHFQKARLYASCLFFSIVVHLLALGVVRLFGSYQFGAAVDRPYAVMVSLAGMADAAAPLAKPPGPHEEPVEPKGDAVPPPEFNNPAHAVESAAAEPQAVEPEPQSAAAEMAAKAPAAPPSEPLLATEGAQSPQRLASAAPPPEASPQPAVPAASATPVTAPSLSAEAGGKEPFSAKHEKLSYVVSMLGLPVGKAELEAKNEKNLITISLKMKSNAAAASVYPVDDLVETQRVDGRYLMTKIRQQEGNFRSDETFTINLEKKKVSWTDNINYRNLKLTVPTGEVLDTLSAIYSLRNRALQVGRTETLHVFDSETYAEVPVEILRREEVRLPNLAKVNTLVLRPLQKTAGIFRRTGDILIWMTDDADKVPVRIVTSIALGKVTAELVSAETEPHVRGQE